LVGAASVGAVVVAFVLAYRGAAADDGWEARVYKVCEQYASLDLSGLAPLCKDAGYQQTMYVQPTGAPPYWPTVHRVIQPEDMDR
jgi:hypothetical protein